VVPKGTDLIPPTEKADNFDHNPYLKQTKSYLNILFEMDSELDGDLVLKEGGTLLSGSWE